MKAVTVAPGIAGSVQLEEMAGPPPDLLRSPAGSRDLVATRPASVRLGEADLLPLQGGVVEGGG